MVQSASGPATLQELDLHIAYGPGDDRLRRFYIPALSASIRYDRMTGFFTSGALAVAGAGVAHLIANGGHMRLLTGAQLSPDDVAAIRAGHDLESIVAARMDDALPSPETLQDQLLHDRLAALAWMVANGALEVRVVLPKGADGFPLPAPETPDYFHPKVGIFTDAQGSQIAFSGSINESIQAWEHNYEQFFVFRAWVEGLYVAEAVARFERLWNHQEPDWISLPIPEAARQKLLRYTPSNAPTRDPLEPSQAIYEQVTQTLLAQRRLEEQALLQFVRDAPYLPGASELGAATCALTPWPHQRTVARRLVEGFPARRLLADEVGLGKTIEAGLALRQLWLSGVVRRALVLAPKSVLRQWQEELYEKFALDVPLYDGKVFWDIHRREIIPTTPNPWDSVSLALASSQLVKRRERQQALLAAHEWDLIIVDEAHHARRRDFLDPDAYRPNRLLELLSALQERTRGLLLMTATPMQVHPVEAWDLLNLLGLSDEWGADGRNFLAFYQELRRPFADVDWEMVFRLLRSELQVRGGLDKSFSATAQDRLGVVDWQRVRSLVDDAHPRRALAHLAPPAQSVAVGMVRQHTPLRRLVYRNTRNLLREYREKGLLGENVPYRDPRLEWIAMREQERDLYERIDEYIAHFYRKYEGERKGLGFVMTVYRRRLTSSFYAVQRSLERRLAFLYGQTGLDLDEDDLEQEALSLDSDDVPVDDPAAASRALYQDEIAYVEDFIHQLKMLGGHDTKIEKLLGDLQQVFRERDTVIVFTQYTDTMDFIREQLRQTYGRQVACYSGRGGEVWDGVMWVPITKEELKTRFREGQAIKVLICTEAASEGLNLQTCGVLINYDMPWNPMRVEQRIGRIDRIGQRYERVWVRNYFYEDTVEAQVYRALQDRIDWFQDVVGPLQPILAQVGQIIQTVAMVPEAERKQALQETLSELQSTLDRAEAGLDLDQWAETAQVERADALRTPITLPELAQVLTTSARFGARFRPHEQIAGAFWLRQDGGEVAVTFDGQTFDDHPNTVQLLTFGTPLFDALLDEILPPGAGAAQIGPLLRVQTREPLPRVAYYGQAQEGRVRRLDRLNAVREALKSGAETAWPEANIAAAQADLQAAVNAEWAAMTGARSRIAAAQQSALEARAALLLTRAALIELALGQQPGLFDGQTYPAAFDLAAVVGLKRHGYPWTPLLRKGQAHLRAPHPTDPFFIRIQNESVEQLKRRFEGLRQRAERLVQVWAK